eukprot:5501915-Pyramimonas_sp.AAC.1
MLKGIAMLPSHPGQQREGLRRPLRMVPVGPMHPLPREGELPLLESLLQRALPERHPSRAAHALRTQNPSNASPSGRRLRLPIFFRSFFVRESP